MTNDLSIGAHRRRVLSEGRINQKRRTRQALLDAALALNNSGRQPTLQEIADKAMVSRATAYRYFPSVEALTHDAYLDRAVLSLEKGFAPGDDPIEAIGRAAEEINRLLLNDEVGTHVIERVFMQAWLGNDPDARPPRPGRRMKFIEPILTKLREQLGTAARARLRIALTLTMGTEAVLSMRDIADASVEDAIAAGRWAAQALVKQALAEEADRPARKSASWRGRGKN